MLRGFDGFLLHSLGDHLVVGLVPARLEALATVVAAPRPVLHNTVVRAHHRSRGTDLGAVHKVAGTAVLSLPQPPVELEIDVVQENQARAEEEDVMYRQAPLESPAGHDALEEPLDDAGHDNEYESEAYEKLVGILPPVGAVMGIGDPLSPEGKVTQPLTGR